MSREEFLLRMKNITNMYSMPYRAENMQPIHYACREYDKLAYEQQNEIERLNNIINELEKWLKMIPKYFMDKRSLNNGVYIEQGMQKQIDLTLDKLKELKESGNNE